MFTIFENIFLFEQYLNSSKSQKRSIKLDKTTAVDSFSTNILTCK